MAQDEAYSRAEWAITAALRAEATSLDLRVLRLAKVPESLGQLTQLWSLDLSVNQLMELPEFLGRLTQLRHLRLSKNYLSEIPEALGQLTQVEHLDLSGNQLTVLPETLGYLTHVGYLDLSKNRLRALPESLGQLTQMQHLDLSGNHLKGLPESLGQLTQMQHLDLSSNYLRALPESLGQLAQMQSLNLKSNQLPALPESMGQLTQLHFLDLSRNRLTDLPVSLTKLRNLGNSNLDGNPLNPELAAAYREGWSAVQRYIQAKAEAQVVLNEAKLILIGEGEVGKSCLLGALRDDSWEEGRPTTHGIEIKSVQVIDAGSSTSITLNGWDFGGQRVYRPTHQLFFSAPAVYLVVWKPREGPQQGFVKEWIKLVKHREPDAKILVVATHGGPKERQPDIDRQEIWDLFGKDLVLEFFLVESKPDERTQERHGVTELKQAIARVAAGLPEVGRAVPKRWEETRKALQSAGAAYLSLEQVFCECSRRRMTEDEARDFVRISHRLGHLIHYEHDPALRDIVILKPDWLATAISLVLDDRQTRETRGVITFSRLAQLWNDPERPEEFRYDSKLHPLFLRLMERFDLSYKVAVPSEPADAISFWQRIKGSLEARETVTDFSRLHYTSLIAQLVPDVRPDPIPGWPSGEDEGNRKQVQICQIVDAKAGQTAAAEGLFFQLIVRLHKFSLGRNDFANSAHWQRGLALEDDYGARALLEHVGNDVRITVRAPYPERFLTALTYEVKWLVESFWAGLRCDIMVPCLNREPCTCIGLFDVRKLIENKKRKRSEQPCPVCNEWQNIDTLLYNSPAARPDPLEDLLVRYEEIKKLLTEIRLQARAQRAEVLGRFDGLDVRTQALMSRVDAGFAVLMQSLLDEAKEGPRLFSLEPVSPDFFDRPKWISEKFRITLWCEHSRLPLPALNGPDDSHGVYEVTLRRDWVAKAAPFLKLVTGTLRLVVPVAAVGASQLLEEAAFKKIEKQLDLGQKSLDAVLTASEKAGGWLGRNDAPEFEPGSAIAAQGAVLRQLQAWLKEIDPGYGGLVRVQNKRQEFLWVHQNFEAEY